MLRVRVRSAADLLAAVPYLIGFHPSSCLVGIGLRGNRLIFAARVDLPPADVMGPVTRQLAVVVAHQRVRVAAVIGYGPPDRVDPAARAAADAFLAAGLAVHDVIRVTGERHWSLLCTGCCPPDGTPFDVTKSPVAAAFAYAGYVALPDRETLVRGLAPVGGLTRVSMRQATARAEVRLLTLLDPAASPAQVAAMTAVAGERAVTEALTRHRRGERLSDDEVAWLTLLLAATDVRDFAWQQIVEPEPHIGLWSEAVRRAEPDLVPAPASLLAFAAWRAGQGALAAVAVERALRADPAYPLALLMDELLLGAVSPSTLDGWPEIRLRRGWGGRRRSSSRRAGNRRA
jgi:hypothetical protein